MIFIHPNIEMRIKLIPLIILLFQITYCHGQSLKGDYPIHTMIINGNALSNDRLDTDKLRVFIIIKESDYQMKVYSVTNNTNSQGVITDIEYKYIPEISSEPSTTAYKFNWHFSNNYDAETGIAQVEYQYISTQDKGLVYITIKSLKDDIIIMSKIDDSLIRFRE